MVRSKRAHAKMHLRNRSLEEVSFRDDVQGEDVMVGYRTPCTSAYYGEWKERDSETWRPRFASLRATEDEARSYTARIERTADVRTVEVAQ
jgi:hypothetical protein